MLRRSAGVLAYRQSAKGLEVFLIQPGGPFKKKMDVGAWMIPKGEINPREDPLAAARREFAEETGVTLQGPFAPLGEVRQAGGKYVAAWATQADIAPAAVVSMEFEIEWPPRSGKRQSYPEVDRAAWFDMARARQYVLPSQMPFLDRLEEALAESSRAPK